MTGIAVTALTAEWMEIRDSLHREIATMSDESLQQLLSEKLVATARSYFEASLILVELERRGACLDSIPVIVRRVMGRVAYGSVIPELIVYCGADSSLLDRLSSLSIPDQIEITSRDGLEYVDGDDIRIVDVKSASVAQRNQLLTRDSIRKPHEQKEWLRAAEMRRRERPVAVKTATAGGDISEQREAMTAKMPALVLPEWEVRIREMARANKWPLAFATTRFLIGIGKAEASR